MSLRRTGRCGESFIRRKFRLARVKGMSTTGNSATDLQRGGMLEFVGRVPSGTKEVSFSLRGLNGDNAYEGFFKLPFATAASDPALVALWRCEADIARRTGMK